jgi:hypothetical protein
MSIKFTLEAPRLHPMKCSMCRSDAEVPYITMYNWRNNARIKICSRSCFEFYSSTNENIARVEQRLKSFVSFKPIPTKSDVPAVARVHLMILDELKDTDI